VIANRCQVPKLTTRSGGPFAEDLGGDSIAAQPRVPGLY